LGEDPEKEAQLAQYRPMMRFTLTDKERRLFTAERMCFMSGIDDWIHGEFDKPVARLPCKLIPLLGRDEFFESM